MNDNKEFYKNIVIGYIEQSLNGLEVEHQKFDFKREWYDLKSEKGKYEFLKDTSSMVNTVGLDAYIVIGFDDKSKEFNNSKFTDCGLRDSNEIVGLVNRYITPSFDINSYDIEYKGHSLSILHIPNSLQKPHVINLYKQYKRVDTPPTQEINRIFVRKNSTAQIAGKYDIEMMIYDRKNIIPEFECFISITKVVTILFNAEFNHSQISLVIENTGRRPLSISALELEIKDSLLNNDRVILAGTEIISNGKSEPISSSNLLIQCNEIKIFDRINFSIAQRSYGFRESGHNIKAFFEKMEIMQIPIMLKITIQNGDVLKVNVPVKGVNKF